MKKILLSFSALLFSFTAYSLEYQVRIPFEAQSKSNSGTPEEPKEIWIPIDPVVSAWVDHGDLTDCTWSPLQNTISIDILFEQKSDNCVKEQIQTTQNYEKSNLTDIVRPVGEAITSSRFMGNISSSQQIKGTRYTHTLVVGDYGSFSIPTYGYFSSAALELFSVDVLVAGSIDNSYKGFAIDYLISQGGYLSLRLLPLQTEALKYPIIVIDGVTCSTNSFVVNSVYNSVCPDLNLESKIGKTLKIDMYD